nr:hypothetical protein BJQ95_02370 [Cryobacterium sp. SO1]
MFASVSASRLQVPAFAAAASARAWYSVAISHAKWYRS